MKPGATTLAVIPRATELAGEGSRDADQARLCEAA